MQSIVLITVESLGFGATGIFASLSAAELLKIVDSLSQLDQLFTNRTFLTSTGEAVATTAVRISYHYLCFINFIILCVIIHHYRVFHC